MFGKAVPTNEIDNPIVFKIVNEFDDALASGESPDPADYTEQCPEVYKDQVYGMLRVSEALYLMREKVDEEQIEEWLDGTE